MKTRYPQGKKTILKIKFDILEDRGPPSGPPQIMLHFTMPPPLSLNILRLIAQDTAKKKTINKIGKIRGGVGPILDYTAASDHCGFALKLPITTSSNLCPG